jgi:hypothetical protein
MMRAGRDLAELARELGVPKGTLRVWQTIATGGTHGLDRTREGVIALTRGAYERLDGVIGRADLDTPMLFASESIDPWRVKDAVAHATHYKARVLHRLGGGFDEYFDPDAWDELEARDRVLRSMDAFTRRRHGPNHLVYVRWRDESPKDVLAWHRRVHKSVLAALESAPETWFSTGERKGFPRLSRSGVGELSAHLDTHLRDIKRALESR